MLQNTSFLEKVKSRNLPKYLPELTYYFCFMRGTQGDNYMCLGKQVLNKNLACSKKVHTS